MPRAFGTRAEGERQAMHPMTQYFMIAIHSVGPSEREVRVRGPGTLNAGPAQRHQRVRTIHVEYRGVVPAEGRA